MSKNLSNEQLKKTLESTAALSFQLIAAGEQFSKVAESVSKLGSAFSKMQVRTEWNSSTAAVDKKKLQSFGPKPERRLALDKDI